ncbi:MAG: helix-turn-helix domain-containing protein [Actinomycetota bacterium]
MAPRSSRSAATPADVVEARRRSLRYGLDPGIEEIPHAGDPGPAADVIRQLSAPVLDHLVGQIAGSSLAVVLADRDGRLTRRDAASRETLVALDRRSLDLGYSLAETDVGTNGVGTSLETRRPALVVGDGHFLECFQHFTCANAPIVHPVTGRVEGTVGVVCPVDDTGPLLMPTALRLASQIGDVLLEEATPTERFLLREFVRQRRSPRSAVATLGEGVLIATPAAQRLLADADAVELWRRVERSIGSGRTVELEHARPSGSPLRLRCRPLHRGGEIEGAIVELLPPATSDRGRSRRRSRPAALGDLVGASDAWQEVVREALLAGATTEPVLLVGERGTGRLAVARAIAERGDRSAVEVVDAARVLIDGPSAWLQRAERAFAVEGTVVLRRIDHLADDLAAALAALVADEPPARLMATSLSTEARDPGLAMLIDQVNVFRIDLPPLRSRRSDIAPLAEYHAAGLGRPGLDRRVVDVLSRQSWPGNVTELAQAVRAAHAKARTRPVEVGDLPRAIRLERSRKPLHGLQQQEADAILTALRSSATRAEAAEQLGISRATLFRRINAYGLEVEDL